LNLAGWFAAFRTCQVGAKNTFFGDIFHQATELVQQGGLNEGIFEPGRF
jgi:hypothetical protein